MCSSVVFSILTKLCNHHHNPLKHIFHHPTRKPCIISSHSPFYLPPPPSNHKTIFSMDLPVLDTSYERNHVIRDLLCLASFTYHDVFKVHPSCSTCQDLVPSYSWIHCMERRVLRIHSPADGHLGCLHFWAVVNSATMNMDVQFLCGCTCSFL